MQKGAIEIDASPCAGDYESRHHAYWSILTEAVSSNHSKDEIRQIAENNRELAVDTLTGSRPDAFSWSWLTRDSGGFLCSVGYGALFAEDMSIVWRLIGLVVWGVAAWSLWRMVAGAFRYNSSHWWIALGARIAVAMLALFVVARLNEKIQAYRRRELGIIRGVLIPLVVFALVYRYGIRPMIGRKGW